MDEKVIKKLKETNFAEKILEVNDAEGVMEVFKDAGVEISKEDAKDVFEGKESLFSQVAGMSKEEIGKCAGGYTWVPYDYYDGGKYSQGFDSKKGSIANLSDNAGIAAANLALDNNMGKDNADMIGAVAAHAAEGAVGVGLLGGGAALAATTIGAAVGIKKIVSAVRNKTKNMHRR